MFGPADKMKAPLFIYHNITGPNSDLENIDQSGAENVFDATMATFTGGAFDATNYVYAWDGPAAESFNKITPATFETAVKESLDVKYNEFNAYIGDKTLGEFYYAWLTEIGALGKDALGTARGDAWWPGAYQK